MPRRHHSSFRLPKRSLDDGQASVPVTTIPSSNGARIYHKKPMYAFVGSTMCLRLSLYHSRGMWSVRPVQGHGDMSCRSVPEAANSASLIVGLTMSYAPLPIQYPSLPVPTSSVTPSTHKSECRDDMQRFRPYRSSKQPPCHGPSSFSLLRPPSFATQAFRFT